MSRKPEGWYVIQSEPVIRHGPITTTKLKNLYSARIISNTTYVWNSAGKDSWQPLHLCDLDNLPTNDALQEMKMEPELLPNLRYELNQLREQNAVQLNQLETVKRERNFYKDQIHEERMSHKSELRKLTADMTEKVNSHAAQYENTCQALRQENAKFRTLLHAAVQMPASQQDNDSEFFHPSNFPPRLHPQLSTLSLKVTLSPRQSYQMVYPPNGDVSTQDDILHLLEMDTESQASGLGGREDRDDMSVSTAADRAVHEENKRLSAANEHLQKRLRELTSIKTRQEIKVAGLEARIKVLEEELHEGDSRDMEGIRELREQNKAKESIIAEANHLINAFIQSSQSRLLENSRLTRAVMLPPDFAEKLESWLDYRDKFWRCTTLLLDLQQMSRRLRMQLRNVVNNQSAKLKQYQYNEETGHHVNGWTAELSREFENVLTQYHRSEFTILNALDKLKEASLPQHMPTHQPSASAMMTPAVGTRSRHGSTISDRFAPSPLQPPRSSPLQSPISPPPPMRARQQELADIRRGSSHSIHSVHSVHSTHSAFDQYRRPSPSPSPGYPIRSASPLSLPDRTSNRSQARSMDMRYQRQISRSAEPPDPRRGRSGSRTVGGYEMRALSARSLPRNGDLIPHAGSLRAYSDHATRPPPLLGQSSVASITSLASTSTAGPARFLTAPQLQDTVSTVSNASGLSDIRPISSRGNDGGFAYGSDQGSVSGYANGVSRPNIPEELRKERIAQYRAHQRITSHGHA